jgi:hypothetical protein
VTSSMGSLDRDGLRAMIRQVLSDELPDAVRTKPAPDSSTVLSTDAAPGRTVYEVSVRDDTELHAFALRVLSMADNPKQRADLVARRVRFVLTAGSQPGRTPPSRRIDKGAVTEAQVKDAARVGATLLLGRRAVLTPLARDKARSLGVVIERES